ncbi:hypothetical protein EMCRGX_G007626 [Ephydatia muelleri]
MVEKDFAQFKMGAPHAQKECDLPQTSFRIGGKAYQCATGDQAIRNIQETLGSRSLFSQRAGITEGSSAEPCAGIAVWMYHGEVQPAVELCEHLTFVGSSGDGQFHRK